MPEDAPLAAPAPPRPPVGAGPLPDVADRLRRWREDPRVGAVALLAVALVAGAFWFRSGTAGSAPGGGAPSGGVAGAAPMAPTTASSTTTTPPASVVVHVAGAVAQPGVVTLPAGSRVIDAIDAAGGTLRRADLDRLNLAALLADGQRVLVARVGDPPTAPEPAPAASGGSTTAPLGPLNLNTATAAELETLPGIGPTLAAAIVEERERRGGFTDISQLRDVRGIGEMRFADVRDLVMV